MSVKMMQIADLKEDQILSKIFLKKDSLLDCLVEAMKTSGFRPDKPIIVDDKDNTVVDGHTRLEAARKAGLTEVPVYSRTFKDDNERLDVALAEQRDRRELTDDNILQCYFIMEKNGFVDVPKPDKKASGKTPHNYQAIADKIGCSVYKIQMVKSILKACKTAGDIKKTSKMFSSHANDKKPFSLRQAWLEVAPEKDNTPKKPADGTTEGSTSEDEEQDNKPSLFSVDSSRVVSKESLENLKASISLVSVNSVFVFPPDDLEFQGPKLKMPKEDFEWFLVGMPRKVESK